MAEREPIVIKPVVPFPEQDSAEPETRLLGKIGRLIGSSMSLDDAAEAALTGVINLTGCDVALLFLRDSRDLQLKAVAASSSGMKMRTAVAHQVGECLCGLAARDGNPIYCFDIVCDPRCTLQECKEAGIRSFAALPLKDADEVLGILGLASPTPRDFGKQAAFLEALATVISIGLRNSLQHEQLLRRAADLELEINERTRAEHALRLLNVTLQTLYRCNEAIVQATDEIELLKSVCQILVDVGGLRMAWVGYREDDPEKSVRVMASAGSECDYPHEIRVTWSEGERGAGPTGTAIRTGRPSWTNNTQTDANFGVWREAARKRQFLSSAALALSADGEPFGALTLYSSEPGVFNEETIEQYAELARNLAYGVMALRTREERNRAESAVRQSESQLSAFVHNAPYGVTRASIQQDRFLSVNPAVIKMLAYDSEADLLAMRLSRDLYIDPQGRRDFLSRLPSVGEFSGIETRWKTKDNKAITVRASGRVLADPLLPGDGVVEGIFEDVTQQRLLEDQLRQAQKMEVMGRLASGVAHDFNNLLGVVLGYCGLLCNELPPDSPVLKRVQPIKMAAEQATSLTAQLLAFNRRQLPQSKVLNLNQVISEATNILHRLIGEDIELKLELHQELWKTRADPGQIVQLVMNIAVNARDAIPGIGTLLVKTANIDLPEAYTTDGISVPPGRYVLLTISDTGIGMDASTRARIFEPFFTTKAEGKGTGLGLATVQSIVSQAGGYISAESELGKGTTFNIYLPWVESEVAEATVNEASAPEHGCETIVLVEDTIALREIIQEGLRALGYEVIVASSSINALDIARNYDGKLDLLLTDVIMPELSGPDLAKQFVALRSNARVLFMSGYIDEALAHFGLENPQTAFIQKPFGFQDLGKKLREMLALK